MPDFNRLLIGLGVAAVGVFVLRDALRGYTRFHSSELVRLEDAYAKPNEARRFFLIACIFEVTAGLSLGAAAFLPAGAL